MLTANALYDAVEPSVVWKQLFREARKEILSATDGKNTPVRLRLMQIKMLEIYKFEFQANDLFIFVLKTFRLQDEEVQKMQLPLVYAATLDLMKVCSIFRSILF